MKAKTQQHEESNKMIDVTEELYNFIARAE